MLTPRRARRRSPWTRSARSSGVATQAVPATIRSAPGKLAGRAEFVKQADPELVFEAAMQLKVGTFNLNNLFSRFDFSADLSTASASSVKVEQRTSFTFTDPAGFKLRTYLGKLVIGKPAAERALIAARIKRLDLDVLAVQEVEDIDTLRQFNRDELGGLYGQIVLIEGNDPRLIDVALLSKLPLGAVTSWQHVPDPLHGKPLFSRDLLQVEVLSRTASSGCSRSSTTT